MKRELTFIHSADIHLDSPFKGLATVPENIFQQMINSTFVAFNRLIEAAIQNHVDFVLIAGDLFDEEARSLKAQLKVKEGFEKLYNHGIEVFLSFGNHDHINGNYFKVEYPKNVHLFESEKVSCVPFYKNNEHTANIFGFSYESRGVRTEKIMEYKIDEKSKDVFQIGMLHGSIASNKEHDVYAPFKLTDLQNSQMDYWALGHIHKKEVLVNQPLSVYPGNIQGRHAKETGEKGFYIVNVEEDGIDLTFLPVHEIRFEQCLLDVSYCETLDELIMRIQQEKEIWRAQFGKCVIRLEIKVDIRKLGITKDTIKQELEEIINDGEEGETNWIWVEKLNIQQLHQWNKEELKKGTHFTGELLRLIEKDDSLRIGFQEVIGQRELRKLIDEFTDEELEEMKRDAENLLLDALLEGDVT